MSLICLNTETYSRIEEYAQVAGISVELAASRAIERWMDASGDSAMIVLKKIRRKKKLPALPTEPTALLLLQGTGKKSNLPAPR